MKIRWTNGSVRFRITPQELAALRQGQSISEALAVPGGRWTAAIAPGGETTAITVNGSDLVVTLSATDVDRLASDDTEGVYFRLGDPDLRYFIEKDFPCIHPKPEEVQEPEAETFAAPPGFSDRHSRGRACSSV